MQQESRPAGFPRAWRLSEGVAIPWVYLLVAGLCEVGFTTCLKAYDELTKFWWSVGFVALLTASMGILTLAIRGDDGIEMGTAYAGWTGIGAAGTVIVQII